MIWLLSAIFYFSFHLASAELLPVLLLHRLMSWMSYPLSFNMGFLFKLKLWGQSPRLRFQRKAAMWYCTVLATSTLSERPQSSKCCVHKPSFVLLLILLWGASYLIGEMDLLLICNAKDRDSRSRLKPRDTKRCRYLSPPLRFSWEPQIIHSAAASPGSFIGTHVSVL